MTEPLPDNLKQIVHNLPPDDGTTVWSAWKTVTSDLLQTVTLTLPAHIRQIAHATPGAYDTLEQLAAAVESRHNNILGTVIGDHVHVAAIRRALPRSHTLPLADAITVCAHTRTHAAHLLNVDTLPTFIRQLDHSVTHSPDGWEVTLVERAAFPTRPHDNLHTALLLVDDINVTWAAAIDVVTRLN
jgi:hypothetical protein